MSKFIRIGQTDIIFLEDIKKQLQANWPGQDLFDFEIKRDCFMISLTFKRKNSSDSYKEESIRLGDPLRFCCSDQVDDLISNIVLFYPKSGKRVFPKKHLRKYSNKKLLDYFNKGYRFFAYCWKDDTLVPVLELTPKGWKYYEGKR